MVGFFFNYTYSTDTIAEILEGTYFTNLFRIPITYKPTIVPNNNTYTSIIIQYSIIYSNIVFFKV